MMNFLLALVSLTVGPAAWSMPVAPIHITAKVISFQDDRVNLDYSGKKVHVAKAAVNGQKLKANGKEQEILLTPEDYFKMKQAYLLGLN